MASIRSENTKPEIVLADAAGRAFAGLTVVKHARHLAGRPDVFIPELRLALFCDGCLFHGCPIHCRVPRRNRAYWEGKIQRNIRRDRRTNRTLRASGMSVWHIWEHDCSLKDMHRLELRLRSIQRRLREHP
jgi:DNA mismatch endonuclease, patch repair protein